MIKVSALRDKLISGVLQIPHVRLTGDPTDRLPGIASFAVEGVEGESMVYDLVKLFNKPFGVVLNKWLVKQLYKVIDHDRLSRRQRTTLYKRR